MAAKPVRTARFTTLAAATDAAITTTEAKSWCNVTTDDDDSIFDDLVVQATDWAQSYLDIVFVQRAWQNYFDRWPDGEDFLELSPWPILEIDGLIQPGTVVINYLDENFATQTLSSSATAKNNKGPGGPEIHFRPENGVIYDWPTAYSGVYDAIRIAYAAGIAQTEADIPKYFKIPMLNFVLAHYEGRSCGVDEGRLALLERSLAPWRRTNPFKSVF